MKAPARPGIILVATRELRWMRRDRLALFLAIGVPIIAFTILALIFSNAVIRNLQGEHRRCRSLADLPASMCRRSPRRPASAWRSVQAT